MANIISLIKNNIKPGPKRGNDNDIYIALVDGDPTDGGVDLPVGSQIIWVNNGVARKFFKTGEDEVSWTQEGISSETLQQTLANGNTTGGVDIVVSSGDEISGEDAAAASGLDGSPLIIHGGAGDGAGGLGPIQASAYGNTRGAGAIDLQQVHGAVTQVAAGDNSILIGGTRSTLSSRSENSIIIGGYDSSIDVENSIIAGGRLHQIYFGGSYSAIVGGWSHDVQGNAYFTGVVGGADHTINAGYTGIVGGGGHTASAGKQHGFLGGDGCTITGGFINTMIGSHNCTMESNVDRSTIIASRDSTIATGSDYSAIIAGQGQLLSGDHSFASGRRTHIGDYWKVVSVNGAEIEVSNDATTGGQFSKFASGSNIEFKSFLEQNNWVSSATTVVSVVRNTPSDNAWASSTIITMSGTVSDIVAGDILKANTGVITVIGAEVSGQDNIASNSYASATGFNNVATGLASHARGDGSFATGKHSTAIGDGNYAHGDNSFAGGWGTFTEGNSSLAFGWGHAHGNYSISLGSGGYAVGYASFTANYNGRALDHSAFASGYNTWATGKNSFSAGRYTHAGDIWEVKSVNSPSGTIVVKGNASATGKGGLKFTAAQGIEYKAPEEAWAAGAGSEIIVGTWTVTPQTFTSATYNGLTADTTLTMSTTVTGVVAGDVLKANANLVHGQTVTGYKNNVAGKYSFATGGANNVTGWYSVAMGKGNLVDGEYSAAIGINNLVAEDHSFAAGDNNQLFRKTNYPKFALGSGNLVTSDYSLATGLANLSAGWYSIAHGLNSKAGFIHKVVARSGTDITVLGDATTPTARFSGSNPILFTQNNPSTIAYTATSFSSMSYDATTRRTTITMDGTVTDVPTDGILIAYGTQDDNNQWARGQDAFAGGWGAFADGYSCYAIGILSRATGSQTYAYASYSQAHGKYTVAAGKYSIGFGKSNTVTGAYSVISGLNNTLSGKYSFVAGETNVVDADESIVAGYDAQIDSCSSLLVTGRAPTAILAGRSMMAGSSNCIDSSDNSGTFGWGNLIGGGMFKIQSLGGTTLELWGDATGVFATNHAIYGWDTGGGGGQTRTALTGVVSAAYSYDDSLTSWVDETTDANDSGTSDVTLLQTNVGVDDAFYIGGAGKFYGVDITLNTEAIGDYTLVWEYWNSVTWSTLTVVDPTDGLRTTLDRTATSRIWEYITFTAPGDWAVTSVNGSSNYYYIRCRITAGTSTQGAIGSRVRLLGSAASESYDADTNITTITLNESYTSSGKAIDHAGRSNYNRSGSISFGRSNVIASQYGAVGGADNAVSGWYAFALGSYSLAAADYSFVAGKYCVGDAQFSIAAGVGAKTQVTGSFALAGNTANPDITEAGQSQRVAYHLDSGIVTTTGNKILDSGGDEILLPQNTVLTYIGTLTLMNTTDNTMAGWKVEGCVSNFGGTATVHNPTETVIYNGIADDIPTITPTVFDSGGTDYFRWQVDTNSTNTCRWSLELTCSWVSTA